MTTLNNRFEVRKTLGQGAQGTVYLGHDLQLDRPVALKALKPGTAALDSDEIRLSSRLQHPNIITLYDAFQGDSQPWLVFEFVEGETLAQRIKRDGAMLPVKAVTLILGVLDGLAYAHAQGVLHRDIKPQNIMIDAQDRPRIADFGIAAVRGSAEASKMAGTAGYMAPEMLRSMPVDRQADIFAAGMTLYLALTGQNAAQGESAFAILHRVANEPFVPPSQVKSGIDEKLDHLVMVALFKDPKERYSDAAAMADALREWLGTQAGKVEEAAGAGNSTIDFLLRRMRHTEDFPALSQAITAINRINESDAERLQVLSDVVLNDFSLTNKLLRIVNSATYSQFGGTISTISRAIVILGFDAIRNLAITLLLFEHMHNKGQAETLRDATLKAFFGGLLARELGRKGGGRDIEETLICGMFSHLGKLLTIYYFHEESVQIDKRVQAGATEQQAAIAVLGLDYGELAIGVTRHWGFPDRIVNSMQALPEGVVKSPQNQNDRLRLYANLSTEMLPLLEQTPKIMHKSAVALERRYGGASGMSEREFVSMLESSRDLFLSHLTTLGIDHQGSSFIRNLRKLGKAASNGDEGTEPDTLDGARLETEIGTNPAATAVLAAGVQDITNTLVGAFKLNDLLRMILETMYRGIGFERVLLCTRDPKQNVLLARFGFGTDINDIIPGFVVETGKVNDVFQVALQRNADILIEDIDAASIKERVPVWYRKLVPAQTFIVLPLVLDKRVIGMFYADRPRAGTLKIGNDELNLLKTLRNQGLLAIRQKQAGG
ncbi:Serine/threonine-protein kinase PknB [Andreprevotia sp. IGB-42]|uniref:serine/threonine protein kinase n=1 Tax=Andreprevotia sp. IGB-42 TaxID=2497473 RepID=UPI0013578D33|nr:serine/threonine protein kinase [Andreprevotia sp. IGB-42]KAF0813264.1 Serine/threonine-protein kinase PknB [Andreprevotia sp. IGB-42]